MKTPTLVIMAAGLGSRFGGLKQIAPIDDDGNIIIDYSLYDAARAGFKEAVIIIKPENEADFKEHFAKRGNHQSSHSSSHPSIKITYAHQTLEKLPKGHTVPEGRTKPWGTGHAVLCAKPYVPGAFAVINADDFYGAGAFKLIYDFLMHKATPTHHAMVGYQIENTLTESGSVARGVCTHKDGRLMSIQETTEIVPHNGGAAYPKATNATNAGSQAPSSAETIAAASSTDEMIHLPAGTLVSMNMWGFDNVMLDEIETYFEAVLTKGIAENPLKCEYYLPSVVGQLLTIGSITVDILPTVDKWHGVTHAQDMPGVRSAIQQLKQSGYYPGLTKGTLS